MRKLGKLVTAPLAILLLGAMVSCSTQAVETPKPSAGATTAASKAQPTAAPRAQSITASAVPAASAPAAASSKPQGTFTSEPAGPKIQEIQNRGTLIVSVKKSESPTGQHRDVAHFQKRDFELSLAGAIANKLLGTSAKVQVKEFPLADRVPAVQRNGVDLAISAISITEELKKAVTFSDPYAWEGLTLMTMKGAGITGLEGLKGETVAATTEGGRYFGSDLEKIAQEKGITITAKSYGSFEEAAAAVETGQVPAVIHRSIDILVYVAEKPGVFEAIGAPLTREEYGIALKKGDDDLLKLVNSVIGDLKKSGEIKRLAEVAKFPSAHVMP